MEPDPAVGAHWIRHASKRSRLLRDRRCFIRQWIDAFTISLITGSLARPPLDRAATCEQQARACWSGERPDSADRDDPLEQGRNGLAL